MRVCIFPVSMITTYNGLTEVTMHLNKGVTVSKENDYTIFEKSYIFHILLSAQNECRCPYLKMKRFLSAKM